MSLRGLHLWLLFESPAGTEGRKGQDEGLGFGSHVLADAKSQLSLSCDNSPAGVVGLARNSIAMDGGLLWEAGTSISKWQASTFTAYMLLLIEVDNFPVFIVLDVTHNSG